MQCMCCVRRLADDTDAVAGAFGDEHDVVGDDVVHEVEHFDSETVVDRIIFSDDDDDSLAG